MPAEERTERCSHHPRSPAVTRCDGCGRAMCIACATPIRLGAYGAECLPTLLGNDFAMAPEPPSRATDSTARSLALIGFALASLATVVPWSRFGPGSQALGAWSRSGRWSTGVAVAALLGLGLALAQRFSHLRSYGWDIALVMLGAIVALGSLLAVAYPPAFSSPWLGPWIASAAGVLGCGAMVVAARVATPSAVGI